MDTLALEFVLWMILSFFVGCIIGCLLHGVFARSRARALAMAAGGAAAGTQQWSHARIDRSGTRAPQPAVTEVSAAAPRPQPAPKPAKAADPANAPEPVKAPDPVKVAEKPVAKPAATGKPARPQGLASPRGGAADNLQRISGVGPKLESTLHSLGFFHYDQIAAWTPDEVEWVNDHLRFKGRIERDEWIEQARLLAAGNEAAFAERFGSGGMKDASGRSRAGSHTRRP
jgi:NADH-quinone oxidoreductase subunit E